MGLDDDLHVKDKPPAATDEATAKLRGVVEHALAETATLAERITHGLERVPPARVGAEEVAVYWDQGEDIGFNGPALAEKVLATFAQGQKEVIVEIPYITAFACGNAIMPKGLYVLEDLWKRILTEILPQWLIAKCGVKARVDFETIEPPNAATIKSVVFRATVHFEQTPEMA